MTRKALLAAPVFGEGRGGGHLVRSAALVRELRALGREAYLYMPGPEGLREDAGIAALPGGIDPAWVLGTEEELSCRSWEWIVLDRFQTAAGEFKRWAALAPLIGLDEGGAMREYFDFLIDLLPGLPGIHPANLTAPHLLPLPGNRREPAFAFQDTDQGEGRGRSESPDRGRPLSILVSFGAEDPGALTAPAALALAGGTGRDRGRAAVTALFGALNSRAQSPESLEQAGVRVCRNIPDLGERLADYDLVITHFGLTAFEALYAGVPVILVSPTRRHEALALEAGFVSAGKGEAACRKLRGLVYGESSGDAAPPGSAGRIGYRAFQDISARCRELAGRYFPDSKTPRSLASLVSRLTPLLPPGCPACGHNSRPEDPVLARFPERSYRRCRRCSLVYMERAAPPPIEYGAGYFSDSYRRQYGKTYLEDFPGLKKAGKARLRRIRGILAKSASRVSPGPEPDRLLDIGCAFGPFLAAAAEDGFEPAGIDPAAEAVAYVRDRLRIPAVQGFFPDRIPGEPDRGQGFAAITLWYVLEHFPDPRKALAEIHRLLRPGGVLAWSAPSFSGISARKSRLEFLRASPGDHWTVWDPRRVSHILGGFGFEVRKTVITGHHPERFPVIGGLFKGRRGLAYRFCSGISRVLGWGDTFEVYAVKRAGA